MYARKRVMVTGGAGFLGSHLCERLLTAGNDVLCVDNFFTGDKDNILCLLNNPHFELMRHDVTFPLYVEVDEIYNLACSASPTHYQYDPVQTTKTSVHGAINMLGLAKRTGAKILQASTSEVYGDPQVHPQPESYRGAVNPVGPRACYDEGKRCAETLFFDYYRQHKTRIKVARIFNAYGPRMRPDDGRVVSNFVIQSPAGPGHHHLRRRRTNPVLLLRGRSDRRHDPPDEYRRRCYRSDQRRQSRRIHHQGVGGKIIAMTGSKSTLSFHPLPMDDPARRRPDIALAGKILDWRPTVPLRRDLEKTIAFFSKTARRTNGLEGNRRMDRTLLVALAKDLGNAGCSAWATRCWTGSFKARSAGYRRRRPYRC